MKPADHMTYQERMTYTQEIHDLTAAQLWAAWRSGCLTVHQVATWQQRHGCYFNERGEIVSA